MQFMIRFKNTYYAPGAFVSILDSNLLILFNFPCYYQFKFDIFVISF
jgi:hypothetical protein